MASLPVIVHPEVLDEIEHERRYYGDRGEALREKLNDELSEGLDLIEAFPYRYAKHAIRTRIYNLRKFPLSLIYVIRRDTILVVAFAHAKRHPHYWKARLN